MLQVPSDSGLFSRVNMKKSKKGRSGSCGGMKPLRLKDEFRIHIAKLLAYACEIGIAVLIFYFLLTEFFGE